MAADQAFDIQMLHHVTIARLIGAHLHRNWRQLTHDTDSSTSRDLQKLQQIGGRVEYRYRLRICPVQCARIDDACAADAKVLSNVRVPLKQIIVLLLGEQSAFE